MAVEQEELNLLIKQHVKPIVKKIDQDALYPLAYLQSLGGKGLLQSNDRLQHELLTSDVSLIEETAKTCMTTAFNLWCHLAVSTYLRLSERPYLQDIVLPKLERGELNGGTGLSNPMKYYAGLERLILKAKRVDGGYVISGQLPAVSNLGPEHGFACIAEVNEKQRMMAFIPHHLEGLEQNEKVDFLGLNGSATYSCKLNDVFVADQYVISDDADRYILDIRATFILYQIPLGLGVTASAIESMKHASHVQGGCNQFLDVQPEQLDEELQLLRHRTYALAQDSALNERWLDVLRLRLDVVKLTMKAVHANMVHCGGSAYLQASGPSRRLRESYFLVNLTPTVKHLSKLLI